MLLVHSRRIWKLAIVASGVGLVYWAIITWELQRLVPGTCCTIHPGLQPFHYGQKRRLAMDLYLDVVTFAGTMAFDRRLAADIKARTGAETITAAGALAHALSCLGVERIGFASPYVAAINDMAISFLGSIGVQTVHRAEVEGTLDNEGQGALEPDAVFALGLAADHPQAQAIVLSCTDMRSVEIIDRLEQAVGKPVVASNQALMFQAMQSAGLEDDVNGYGRLFECLVQ